MTTHATTISTSRSRRVVGRLLVAMAIAGGAIAAVAAPAIASCWLSESGYEWICSECRSGTGYVNCFTLTQYTNGTIGVHIGIDIAMSQQDAQAILDSPGEEFSATIFGDDP